MAQRAGVSFELERLDLEDDKLIVSGHWSGVRGLRFVRPTLVAADRRILATLEHKPWAPAVDRTWMAAFPWDGDDVDVNALALAVSSQVTVALGAAPAALVAEPAAAPPPAAAAAADAAHELAPERAAAPERELAPGTPIKPRKPAPAPAPDPELALAPAPRQPAPPLAAAETRPVLERDRRRAFEEELYHVSRAREAAERDRDRALAQLDEAVAAREAAVRTRARMELASAEALAAREAAEAAVAGARAQRDEANAQRDEVLLAYRALQRHVQAERAHDDRAGQPPSETEQGDPEEPIGVRKMPAARTVMAELQRPRPASKLPFSVFDLWVVRVLGTVAAGCFILLLISIMRVFV